MLYTIISLINSHTSMDVLPRLSYDTKELPIYKINLDLPVKDRYREIFHIYKDKVKVYSAVVAQTNSAKLISRLNFGKYLINRKTQNPEWYEFIEELANITGITLSQAALLSANYELFCSSIIVQDKDNKIFLGRNLDFETYYVISHLVYEAHYYRNGILESKNVELVGHRGIVNGVKLGKFSVSLNKREKGNILDHLFRIYTGKTTPSFTLLNVIEKAYSYAEAIQILNSTSLTAPAYFIISGINSNEGSIITRDLDTVYRTDELDVDNGIWFLVTTNTDLDKDESPDDFRRIPAQNNLKNIGRENINYENLFSNVMSVYPTNNHFTAFTTIQSTVDGYFSNAMWQP